MMLQLPMKFVGTFCLWYKNSELQMCHVRIKVLKRGPTKVLVYYYYNFLMSVFTTQRRSVM